MRKEFEYAKGRARERKPEKSILNWISDNNLAFG